MVWLGVAGVGLLALLAAGSYAASTLWEAMGPPSGSAYLRVSGRDFRYHGQVVRLRGANFNNEPALGCCGGPDINAINVDESDYAKAEELHANVVRFGIDTAWWQTDPQGFFSVIDRHVGWARRHHLWLIPVVFIPPGGGDGGFEQHTLWKNSGDQDRLVAFWEAFARHYAGQPAVAGYDLLNEPAPPSDEAWRRLAQRLTDAVAAVDPNHFTVVEMDNAGWEAPIIRGDRVVYSSHAYENGDNLSQRALASGHPYIVGEFGSQRHPAYVRNSIVRWEKLGLSWVFFVWREGGADSYGLYQSWKAGDFSRPNPDLLAALRDGWRSNIVP